MLNLIKGAKRFVGALVDKTASVINPATKEKQDEIISTLKNSSELGLDAGTATGGTSNTLSDTTKNWDENIWIGVFIEITGGTGVGQINRVKSNTSNTITVYNDWTTAPDTTSTYRIFGLNDLDKILDKVGVYTHISDVPLYVSSGSEVAYDVLILNKKMYNRGETTIFSNLILKDGAKLILDANSIVRFL